MFSKSVYQIGAAINKNKPKKQTAANNRALASVKCYMNALIFKEASRVLNVSGEASMWAYLDRYFQPGISSRAVIMEKKANQTKT